MDLSRHGANPNLNPSSNKLMYAGTVPLFLCYTTQRVGAVTQGRAHGVRVRGKVRVGASDRDSVRVRTMTISFMRCLLTHSPSL